MATDRQSVHISSASSASSSSSSLMGRYG
jgi:hypothetical protein